MSKINSLTKEQEALLVEQRERWIATGLSTEPANRAEAERGVRLAYEAAKLTPPQFIIWAGSPFAGAWAQALAPDIINAALTATGRKTAQVTDDQVRDQVRDQVGDQVMDQVGDQVMDQVRAQVRDQVTAQVGAQVWAQVGDQVGAQVGDQVWAPVWDQVMDQVMAQVRAQVRAQVTAQVRDQVRDQVWAPVWAPVWAQVTAQVGAQVTDQVTAQVGDRLNNWTTAFNGYYGIYYSSWFDTMRKLGVEHLEPWEGQQTVAENAFWWWCFAGFAVICERPTVLNRDAEGRLHSENGPAMQWPDGWGFYSWHGTRVPEWVITNPTFDQAMREPNSEIRRVAIERIGWDRVIEQEGWTPIATAPDPGNWPHELALYELDNKFYDEPVNLLLMVNGSPDRDGTLRRYAETVPASYRDPIGAAAWQYGVSPDVYAQIARRT